MKFRPSRTIAALMIALMITAPAGAAPKKKTPAKEPVPTGQLDGLLTNMPRYIVPQSALAQARNPKEIETETGGRLGVALVDRRGALLLGFNRDDRFAMCSTFKAPMAAAVLMGADAGKFGIDGQIPFGKDDILDYAPVVKQNRKRGRMSMGELAQAAVEVSDNSAANLLLPMLGGPEGLTAFMRAHGDTMTRLDRNEPTLNENAEGDERDTTTPAAMASLMARLLFTDMKAENADQLRAWLNASSTGDNRIKAGLPEGWTSGSKTGTCGNAYNDVALVKSPAGEEYLLAIYLDRPTVDQKKSEAAIAEAARAALAFIAKAQKSGVE